jgi:putative methionine-R-sulfoxide reductase with GAF domain
VKSYRSATEVLAAIEEVFAHRKRRPGEDAPMDSVVSFLNQGRNYLWTGIYLFLNEDIVCSTAVGPAPAPHRLAFRAPGAAATEQIRVLTPQQPEYQMRFAESKSEAIVPIKIGGRVLGVLDIESERQTAFSPQEQIFLKDVATAVARFLTSHGKYVIKRAYDALASQQERQATLRAAAGEQKSR